MMMVEKAFRPIQQAGQEGLLMHEGGRSGTYMELPTKELHGG